MWHFVRGDLTRSSEGVGQCKTERQCQWTGGRSYFSQEALRVCAGVIFTTKNCRLSAARLLFVKEMTQAALVRGPKFYPPSFANELRLQSFNRELLRWYSEGVWFRKFASICFNSLCLFDALQYFGVASVRLEKLLHLNVLVCICQSVSGRDTNCPPAKVMKVILQSVGNSQRLPE